MMLVRPDNVLFEIQKKHAFLCEIGKACSF